MKRSDAFTRSAVQLNAVTVTRDDLVMHAQTLSPQGAHQLEL